METIEAWNERPDVREARLAKSSMGAERRCIMPFRSCSGVELITLEGIVQPFPLHFHDFWTIGQIVQGNRRMTCRGEVYDLGPEDFVLFGPGEVHGCKPMNNTPLVYRSIVVPSILFAQAFCESAGITPVEGADEAARPVCRFKPVVVRDVVLSACMAQLFSFVSDDEHRDALEEEEALWAFLARVSAYCESVAGETRSAAQAPSSANVARALDYLDVHFASNVSLDDLARTAGVSRYHFIRVFSDKTGLTPHRYLQAVRANRARDLLAAGVDPSEAAVLSGFSDQAHMGRVYKSFYGITPGRYRAATRTGTQEGVLA